jgi:hypothetical protein
MYLKRRMTRIIVLFVTFCSVQSASAQDERFRIGLKTSGNLSWITPTTKNIQKTGNSFGYSYGIMGDYNFQKYYAFSAELIFTNIGGGIEHIDNLTFTDTANRTTNNSKVTYDYSFKYIQLPISIKFKGIWIHFVLGAVWFGPFFFDGSESRCKRQYLAV